jgi:G3E family GTPase
MVELSNGCICCTINEGLVEAVYNVLEHKDRIDYLVIETTGVADPLPIAITFLGTELRNMTRLDSILTVIDAETFTPEHFDSEAAFKQVAYGDIVLLNKTDLADQKKLDELESYISLIKRGARLIRCQYGQVPLPLILDVGLTQIENYKQELEESHHHDHSHHSHHDHSHHHHDHSHHSHHLENDGFVSLSFQSYHLSVTGCQSPVISC